MWKVVEEALEKGQAALLALQERRPGVADSEETPEEKASKHSSGGKSKKDSGAAHSKPDRSRGKHGKKEKGDKKAPEEGDDAADSDGSGFFG